MTQADFPRASYMKAISISKKIFKGIAPVLIISLLLPTAFFGAPKKAVAQGLVPVADLFNAPFHTNNSAQNTMRTSKEFGLDMVVTAIAKTLIKQISKATIQWINSGFKGSPAFIQNPEQFFTGVADRVAGQFIEELGLGFLCEPFRLDLQLQLALEYGGGNFTDEIGCTFSDVLGNIEGFVQGDFTQGGWDGWFQMTQNRNNNPYGAYIEAKTALDIRIASAQGTERLVLDWGDGFQSLKDEFGNILTPGKTIETQLSNVLGTDLRQLELADEINEIMGALVNQLMTQVMSASGLTGAGDSTFDSSGPTDCSSGFCTDRQADDEFATSIAQNQQIFDDKLAAAEAAISSGTFDGGGETGSVNLALRSTNTSQTGEEEFWTNSARAVDGNPDLALYGAAGADRNGVSSTDQIANPFWEIDLRGIVNLRDIQVIKPTNRSAIETVGKFRVFVSLDNNSSPFTSNFNATLAETLPIGISPDGKFFATEVIDLAARQIDSTVTIPINIPGRFVRIQRVEAQSARLSLAEVLITRNNKPTITLASAGSITLKVGDTFIDPGSTVTDDTDTGLVATVTGTVDTNTAGTYTLNYNVTDTGGAQAVQKTRTVTVNPAPTTP